MRRLVALPGMTRARGSKQPIIYLQAIVLQECPDECRRIKSGLVLPSANQQIPWPRVPHAIDEIGNNRHMSLAAGPSFSDDRSLLHSSVLGKKPREKASDAQRTGIERVDVGPDPVALPGEFGVSGMSSRGLNGCDHIA